jgi:AraC-like DNA-binding protein/ligand-binding sensor protein
MNANGQLIETLARSEMVLNYQRAYTHAVGLPLSLRPLETWQLPLHGRPKENPCCVRVARKSRACAACLRAQETLAHRAMSGPAAITCPYGLSEIAVPIKLGSHVIGFLQTGQILRRKPARKAITRAMKRLKKAGIDWNRKEMEAALLQTPVFPRGIIKAIKTLLVTFADHLAVKSNEIMLAQGSGDPPAIIKAKQYIMEHHAEPLSLNQVSQAVNTSLFHFCKLFKAVTGITFTQFVSRVRVEKAKNLLLNRNLRVSEIAIESGFQSLTHFNRMFKEMVGESPSEYRNLLPRAADAPARAERPTNRTASLLEPVPCAGRGAGERPLPDLLPLVRSETGELVEAAA